LHLETSVVCAQWLRKMQIICVFFYVCEVNLINRTVRPAPRPVRVRGCGSRVPASGGVCGSQIHLLLRREYGARSLGDTVSRFSLLPHSWSRRTSSQSRRSNGKLFLIGRSRK
jgi:hypothetical protein